MLAHCESKTLPFLAIEGLVFMLRSSKQPAFLAHLVVYFKLEQSRIVGNRHLVNTS